MVVENESKDHTVKFFTPDEVADILRVSVTTVYRWLKSGKVQGAIQPNGKVWRIPATTVWKMMGRVEKLDVYREV